MNDIIINNHECNGKKFGRLLVLRVERKQIIPSDIKSNRTRAYAYCRCDCGIEKFVYIQSLKKKEIISCGCYCVESRFLPERMAQVINRSTKHGHAARKNKSPEYVIWQGVKNRCSLPSNKCYNLYGGRGIKVCDRWLNSFENFLADMGKRLSSKYSIDRIDVNGDYEPSNCKWATAYEQAHNKRIVKK